MEGRNFHFSFCSVIGVTRGKRRSKGKTEGLSQQMFMSERKERSTGWVV